MPALHYAGRSAILLSAILSAWPLAGCCTIAGYFCGPDKSRWVSAGYDTPQAALATFLEAVRRDNARVICESLSEGFKERHGLPGCFEATIAWQKLKQQVGGLHLLGTAKVSEETTTPQGATRYLLTVAGRQAHVEVRPFAYTAVSYLLDGEVVPESRYVAVLQDLVQIGGDEIDQSVRLETRDWSFPAGVTAADITHVAAGLQWKVDELQPVVSPPVATKLP